ncbi:hypothetical protein Pelo_18892 [Pelomyxa schiedti]|nr:hypothetical protein Pelo_18892 [Pelomyxa schiedti]
MATAWPSGDGAFHVQYAGSKTRAKFSGILAGWLYQCCVVCGSTSCLIGHMFVQDGTGTGAPVPPTTIYCLGAVVVDLLCLLSCAYSSIGYSCNIGSCSAKDMLLLQLHSAFGCRHYQCFTILYFLNLLSYTYSSVGYPCGIGYQTAHDLCKLPRLVSTIRHMAAAVINAFLVPLLPYHPDE